MRRVFHKAYFRLTLSLYQSFAQNALRIAYLRAKVLVIDFKRFSEDFLFK